jgi:hypothetical protein
MRAPRIAVVIAAAVTVIVALAVAAPFALAKGESGGLVTLAAPIPRDAEPGSSLTVTFTVTVPDENGQPRPVTGSPMVLKLTGPDGTTTEGMGFERGTPGTYVASIRVPSSGIQSATFGMRGRGTMADGTSSILDMPFDVDGLLFTTTAHPAPAPAAAAPASSAVAAPDLRVPLIAGLALVLGAIGLTLAFVGRRRTLRSV